MNIKRISRSASLSLAIGAVYFIAAGVPPVYGDDYRVATVDLTRLLNDSLAAKIEKKKLEQLTKRKKEEIEKKKAAIKNLEKKLAAADISPDSEKADEIRNKAKNLARFVQDTEDDLKKRYAKVTKDLMQRALKVVKEYAKKNKYALVLEKGNSDRSLVLYGDSAMDITDEVLKSLNRKKR